MKKLDLAQQDNSLGSVLRQMNDRYNELSKTRNFDPEEEIFKLFIKQKKDETDKEFRKRQNKRIKKFVESRMWFVKKGERQTIKLIKKHIEIIADLFYARKDRKTGEPIQSIIVWANRGGGKSLVAAITIFLCMVWRKMSFTDLAGSAEQALEVYGYVTEFWNCFPVIKERLLAGEPLQTKTELKNKVFLKCIANSQNTARGKHPEGFIADEACQKERFKDDNVLAATNSVLTQEGFLIFYLSTFHLPVGLFAETWDYHNEFGFKRYKWNIYNCLKRCKREIDCKKCRLTRKVEKKDSAGNVVKIKYKGCNGKARKADGWLTFDQVIKIKRRAEIKGYNWRVEFECQRPTTARKIYKTRKVEKSLVNRVELPVKCSRSVGIDWGTSQQCALTLMVMGQNSIIVPWSDFSTGRDLEYIAETLKAVRIKFGDFICYADAEQTYGIMYLRKQGFIVESIPFNKYKSVGIQNLGRYFNGGRVRILNNSPNRILYRQLIKYMQDENGKPLKKDDHGCDSLMCACLRFDYMRYFARDLHRQAAEAVLEERADGESSEVMTF